MDVESRFRWLELNGKIILVVDFSLADEVEFIAATQLLRPTVDGHPADQDIRVLVNVENVRFTPKMLFHAMQVARYSLKKVSRRAGVGFSSQAFALYRIARLNKPNTRIFRSYDEALKYLSEDH